jgi:hypothetical protein
LEEVSVARHGCWRGLGDRGSITEDHADASILEEEIQDADSRRAFVALGLIQAVIEDGLGFH